MKKRIAIPKRLAELCRQAGLVPTTSTRMTLLQHCVCVRDQFVNAGKESPFDPQTMALEINAAMFRRRRKTKRVVCLIGDNPPQSAEPIEPETAFVFTDDDWNDHTIPEWTV